MRQESNEPNSATPLRWRDPIRNLDGETAPGFCSGRLSRSLAAGSRSTFRWRQRQVPIANGFCRIAVARRLIRAWRDQDRAVVEQDDVAIGLSACRYGSACSSLDTSRNLSARHPASERVYIEIDR